MYKNILVLFFVSILCGNLDAQSINQISEKSKEILFNKNKLRPFQTVRMEVDVQTDKGKYPATIYLIEGMKYKIEMATPKGIYIRALDMAEYIEVDPESKIAAKFERHTLQYFTNNHLLNFYPILGISQQSNPDFIVESRGEAMDNNMLYNILLQRMMGSESVKLYYYNFIEGQLYKIVVAQNETELENGVNKSFQYKKYTKSDAGYIYPAIFTTPLGEATVKKIEFNPKLTEKEFNANIRKF